MTKPNVELVTDRSIISARDGIVASDGKYARPSHRDFHRFKVTEMAARLNITGRAGKNLKAAWPTITRRYLGLTVPDFPNIFVMLGQFRPAHGGSVIFHRMPGRYISACLVEMIEQEIAAIDVARRRRSVHQERGCRA